MRTAVVLSGHLRTWEQCRTLLLDKIVNPTQADVFLSTWDVLGFADLRRWSVPTLEAAVTEDAVHKGYGDCLKGLNIETFDPTKFDVKEQINPCSGRPNHVYPIYQSPLSDKIIQRMRSMWYKVWDADRLRRNYETSQGFNYDRVIKARPDIAFFTNLGDYDLTQPLIYIARSHVYLNWNDQFAVGSNAVMTLYCNLYNCLDRYIAEGYRMQGKWVEGLVRHHLQKKNGIGRKITNMRYALSRPSRPRH
jgi:hypothetical protein